MTADDFFFYAEIRCGVWCQDLIHSSRLAFSIVFSTELWILKS